MIKEGKLVAEHQRQSDISFEVVKKDVFAGSVWYFGQVEISRDEQDKVRGFKVSNGRVRDLVFERQ